LFADWDISDNGQSDRASWFEETSLGYVYNMDTVENIPVYTGIQSLSGNDQYFAIDNDEDNEGNPFGIYDGFTDSEKFQTISSGIGRTDAGTSSETGTDVSHTVGTGPYTIQANDSIVVAFAIHGASTLEELIASSRAADTMYNYTLKAPRPILSNDSVCYEDSATLLATGADHYNWYYTKTGGEPFFTGERYVTGILRKDTLFYVSNADNSWESVRTPVRVFLKANPAVTLSGSRFLCENDTLVLIANEADSYLWSPGEETSQSIQVVTPGDYRVTVTDTLLGCVSTSDIIQVEKYESPAAFFEADPQEIKKNEDIEIKMTDLSVNAVNWFWNLSNGQTSTDRNPEFLVNSFTPITVNLTVTAPNGCQDTSSVIIDIITSLEDPEVQNAWQIYPNPTYGSLISDLESERNGPYRILIYTLDGRILCNFEFSKSMEVATEQVDLSGLSKGIYLIRLQQADGRSATKRIIIK
jgi:hypothetical protein